MDCLILKLVKGLKNQTAFQRVNTGWTSYNSMLKKFDSLTKEDIDET